MKFMKFNKNWLKKTENFCSVIKEYPKGSSYLYQTLMEISNVPPVPPWRLRTRFQSPRGGPVVLHHNIFKFSTRSIETKIFSKSTGNMRSIINKWRKQKLFEKTDSLGSRYKVKYPKEVSDFHQTLIAIYYFINNDLLKIWTNSTEGNENNLKKTGNLRSIIRGGTPRESPIFTKH